MDRAVTKRGGKQVKNSLLVAFSLLLVSGLLAFIAVPDRVDPLRHLATLDAAVIKVIENNDGRFVMYRVRPGKIFMVEEAYKKTGDTIKVNEYQRRFTRRVEYLLVR